MKRGGDGEIAREEGGVGGKGALWYLVFGDFHIKAESKDFIHWFLVFL